MRGGVGEVVLDVLRVEGAEEIEADGGGDESAEGGEEEHLLRGGEVNT